MAPPADRLTGLRSIRIANRSVGARLPTFVVAEIGTNHDGDDRVAEKLVLEAARCGADAVTVQAYVTEKRVPRDSPMFDVLKRCELSEPALQRLQALADVQNLVFFATPFDEESVDLLASLEVPAYKIASCHAANHALLDKIASFAQPVIAARGMASDAEADRAIRILEEHGVPHALLHSAAPSAPGNEMDLAVFAALAARYGCPVGYADAMPGIDAPVQAVAAGASIVEKRFTLDKALTGAEYRSAADPAEFRALVTRVRQIDARRASDTL